MPVAREVTRRLKEIGKDNVLIMFGGVIPERDIEPMKALGVREVFGPGAAADTIIAFIRGNVQERSIEVQ
jgi:methylmalonyl-CoA mutase C-terminal domain/subunit